MNLHFISVATLVGAIVIIGCSSTSGAGTVGSMGPDSGSSSGTDSATSSGSGDTCTSHVYASCLGGTGGSGPCTDLLSQALANQAKQQSCSSFGLIESYSSSPCSARFGYGNSCLYAFPSGYGIIRNSVPGNTCEVGTLCAGSNLDAGSGSCGTVSGGLTATLVCDSTTVAASEVILSAHTSDSAHMLTVSIVIPGQVMDTTYTPTNTTTSDSQLTPPSDATEWEELSAGSDASAGSDLGTFALKLTSVSAGLLSTIHGTYKGTLVWSGHPSADVSIAF